MRRGSESKNLNYFRANVGLIRVQLYKLYGQRYFIVVLLVSQHIIFRILRFQMKSNVFFHTHTHTHRRSPRTHFHLVNYIPSFLSLILPFSFPPSFLPSSMPCLRTSMFCTEDPTKFLALFQLSLTSMRVQTAENSVAKTGGGWS